MKLHTVVIALSLCICAAIQQEGTATSPLGNVLQLLDDLGAKIEHDQNREDKEYRKYRAWCEETSVNLDLEIKSSKSRKSKLEARISKAVSDIEVAASKVEDLAATISSAQSDLKKAASIRKKEVAEFQASEKELIGIVATLGKAIDILQRQKSASFAQLDGNTMENLLRSINVIVDAASFSHVDREKLVALVQSPQSDDDDDGDMGAPATEAYKMKSGNIIDTLEDMREKSEGQLSDLRQDELKNKGDHEVLVTSLKTKLKLDNKDMDNEKSNKAEAEELKSNAEGDLEVTVKELKTAQASLATTQEDCMQVAADHDANIVSRAEELKVIAEATKVLREKTGNAAAKAYSFVQVQAKTQVKVNAKAKLQAKAKAESGSRRMRSHAVILVRKLARKHHSSALAQLASRMTAIVSFGTGNGAEPFAKIKGLISELISKLEKEADEEAEEKAYCDNEMSQTSEKKGELEDAITSITAKIDQLAAKSTSLKEQVKELAQEIGEISKEQAEMDKIRQEMHAEYVQTKEDLELGISGVRTALGVLREYYVQEDQKDSLIQEQANPTALSAFMEQPKKPGKPLDTSGAGQGIIGVLEVVESDFATNLSKEEALESDAASEYEKITNENKLAKVGKEQDVKVKTQAYTSYDKTLTQLDADREASKTEMSAVKEYWAKLKDRCVAKPEAYEQRKERRDAEIAGLKEALEALKGEASLFQHPERHFRGLRGAVVSHAL